MAQTAMTVRLDNQTKVMFDSLCEQFGMSSNTAINIFVKAVVRSGRIPFTIEADQSERVRRNAIFALQRARAIAERDGAPDYTLDDINEEIRQVREERAKYNKK
jgi:DNA-damage-inducible protein J